MEALSGKLNEPLGQLSNSQGYLKKLFEGIITPEAAARIALND